MMMRVVLLLSAVHVMAIEAFSLRIHDATSTTFRRGDAHSMSAPLAYANITDSAASFNTLTPPKSSRKVVIHCNFNTNRVNAATRRWNQRYEELRDFHKRHGHVEADEPKALVTWIRNQRMQYRYIYQQDKEHLSFLTAERIHKLEEIGFIWNPHQAKWKQMYAQLVDFRDCFGHCDVPSKWQENSKLSKWVSSQRFKYKARQQGRMVGESIKDEQIEQLNSLGFCWDPKGQTWWAMYKALQEYKKEHGTCAVPQSYPSNPALGVWCRHQRRACRELVLSHTIDKETRDIYVSGIDKDRLAALRDIDFCWLPDPNEPWTSPPKDIFDYQKVKTEVLIL